MTSILIPAAETNKDSLEYLRQLLFSIGLGINSAYEVVVAFDGCSEEFVDHILMNFPFVRRDKRFVNSGRPKNFCGNVNSALRILHGKESKSVIVVNQDTILPSLEYFQRIEYGSITTAIEVSLINDLSQLEGIDVLLDCNQPELDYISVDKFIGFCYYMSAEFLDKVGYLNEYLQASFDDDDISAKANLQSIEILQAPVNVHHFRNRIGAYKPVDLPIRKNQFHILWQIPLVIKHENFQNYIKENYTWSENFKDD